MLNEYKTKECHIRFRQLHWKEKVIEEDYAKDGQTRLRRALSVFEIQNR